MYEIKDVNQLNFVSGGKFQYVTQEQIDSDCLHRAFSPGYLLIGASGGIGWMFNPIIGISAGIVAALFVYNQVKYHSDYWNPQCNYEAGFYDLTYI